MCQPTRGDLPEYSSGLAKYQKLFPLGFIRDEGPIRTPLVVHIDVWSCLCAHCAQRGLLVLALKQEESKIPCLPREFQKPSLCSHHLLYPPSLLWRSPSTWVHSGCSFSGCRKEQMCPFGCCPHLQAARPPGPEVLRETLLKSTQLIG